MSFKCLSEVNYLEFALPINKRLQTERIPICGTIEITRRCNLKCVHCYCNLPLQDKEAQRRELSTKEIFSILDEIERQGCLWLLFT
ncbi:MAG: hypothetical protein NC936_04795, partial [Candidatus Omnitrophica bacterium]|nr:hypothetical protein [Candidatus Omnitrophota bacterium]